MKKYAVLLVIAFVVIEILCGLFLLRSFLFPVRYEKLINQNAIKYNIESCVIASVINVESSFNKKAKSSAGAIGLMQILPSTASYVSEIYNIEYKNQNDLLTPDVNIEIGSAYLRYLLDKFGNLETALASYNAGETVVRSWLKNEEYSSDQKTLKEIPFVETKIYIKKINKNIKNYKKYKNLK